MMPNVTPTMMEMRARAQSKPHSGMAEAEFRARFSALLAQAPPHVLRESAFVTVPANLPPWLDTGIALNAGEQVTVFAVGRVWLARELDLWVPPDFQLWYRIGETGDVFRGTRCSHTFAVREAGRLFFGNYFPGEWATRAGALAIPADAYSHMEGGLCAVVVRWAVPPLEGLQRLASLGDVASLLSSKSIASSILSPRRTAGSISDFWGFWALPKSTRRDRLRRSARRFSVTRIGMREFSIGMCRCP